MIYAFKLIKENNIFSGLGADAHFCISKKGIIHFKNKIDEFRNNLRYKESYAQKHIHKNLSKIYSKNCMFCHTFSKSVFSKSVIYVFKNRSTLVTLKYIDGYNHGPCPFYADHQRSKRFFYLSEDSLGRVLGIGPVDVCYPCQ